MCERARARVLHTATYISKEEEEENERRIHLRMLVLLLLLCEYDLSKSIAGHSLAPYECHTKKTKYKCTFITFK